MLFQIFRREYNLAFYKPLKDRCLQCVQLELRPNPTPERIEEMREHRRLYKVVRRHKRRAAVCARVDQEFAAATFDLQQVLKQYWSWVITKNRYGVMLVLDQSINEVRGALSQIKSFFLLSFRAKLFCGRRS